MANQEERPREAPVSFRPGKLRAALRQRAVRSLTEGQIAKRDLGRYYLLLGQAWSHVQLTRTEAGWLTRIYVQHQLEDDISGDPFIPEHVNPSDYLMSVIKRAIARSQRHGKPAEEILYRLTDKIERLGPLQRAAIVDAIDRIPAETEEDAYNLDNWALIGVPLAEDPLTLDGLEEAPSA